MSEKTVPLEQTVDFNAPILDMDDEPIVQGEGGEVMRIGDACVNALMATLEGDKSDGVQKLKRYNLARKIKGSADDDDYPAVHLTNKQKTLIEGQAEQVYTSLIYARVFEALNGSTNEEDDD